MSPLVSIIIPCYNSEQHVGRAIRSALNQTYRNVEIIVVDDGSTDTSIDVIRSFGDRIRWETGPHLGACMARNRGLELARGELVQFLDADDELLPEKLEVHVPETLGAAAGVLVISGGWHEERKDEFKTHLEDPAGWDCVAFAIEKWVQTSAPLHRRQHLVDIGGFDPSLPCSQERDLHLRLAMSGQEFRMLRLPLYRKYATPGSISRDKLRTLTWRGHIFERARESLKAAGLMTDARRRSLARIHALDAFKLLAMGEREAYRERIRLARLLHRLHGLDVICVGRNKRMLLSVLGPRVFLRLVEALAWWRRRTGAWGFGQARRGLGTSLPASRT